MTTQRFAMDYIDVATRIVEFRTQYPTGSLQQVSIDFRDFGGQSWVIFTAAAYRTPHPQRPGHGTAWEPVPGKTNFTRDSEVQNAETAAWGRAIVAALAADTKKGIASAEEVRNRQVTRGPAMTAATGQKVRDRIGELTSEQSADLMRVWREQHLPKLEDLSEAQAATVLGLIEAVTEPHNVQEEELPL